MEYIVKERSYNTQYLFSIFKVSENRFLDVVYVREYEAQESANYLNQTNKNKRKRWIQWLKNIIH